MFKNILKLNFKILILLILIFYSCYFIHNKDKEVKVDLSGQNLKVVPDSIFKNSEISYLDLGSSHVTFYPPLSALKDSLSNKIEYLDERIGELINLKVLILNSNKLTSLPQAITKLKNIEMLDLSLNKDLEIIQELDKLKQLPKLKVLKIVDVKLNEEEKETVKSVLNKKIKIIFSITEYFKGHN